MQDEIECEARERKRIADEQARAEAERKAREVDEKRRAKVKAEMQAEILDLLTPATRSHSEPTLAEAAEYVAEAIMEGQIPHVKVEM